MRPCHPLLLAAIIVAGSATAAHSQEAADASPPGRLGFGVTLNPSSLIAFDDELLLVIPGGFNNFVVPIRVAPQVTIEPEFGVFRTSYSQTSGTFSEEGTYSNIRLGVGMLVDFAGDRGTLVPYGGARLGVIRARTREESRFGGSTETSSMRQNSWFAGAVMGAQYRVSRHFTVGGEVQLVRTVLGNPQFEPSGGPTSQERSFLTSNGIGIIRWFL